MHSVIIFSFSTDVRKSTSAFLLNPCKEIGKSYYSYAFGVHHSEFFCIFAVVTE